LTEANLPPKDVSAATLWMKLQELPRPHRFVDFPRKGADGEPIGKIAMFVLTQEEQMICATTAEKFAKEKLKDGKKDDLGYESIYGNESVIQILYRACKDADNLTRSAFPSPQAIRQQLTTDECSVLFEAYLTTQQDFGPIVTQLSSEEVDAWIDRLAEGGLAASPLESVSPATVRTLIASMASRLRTLRTDKSSVGSPPDDISRSESS
jgi:hypothetical protein